jgi:hypothetical protein
MKVKCPFPFKEVHKTTERTRIATNHSAIKWLGHFQIRIEFEGPGYKKNLWLNHPAATLLC